MKLGAIVKELLDGLSIKTTTLKSCTVCAGRGIEYGLGAAGSSSAAQTQQRACRVCNGTGKVHDRTTVYSLNDEAGR